MADRGLPQHAGADARATAPIAGGSPLADPAAAGALPGSPDSAGARRPPARRRPDGALPPTGRNAHEVPPWRLPRALGIIARARHAPRSRARTLGGHTPLAALLGIFHRSTLPQLPLVVWLAAAGLALLLFGLCAGTAGAVVRAAARRRVAAWPARRVLGLAGAAALPWLVVWLAPIRVEVSIHGLGPLVGWMLVALLVFALLVLLPMAALLSGAVWCAARRRRAKVAPPAA